MSTVTFEEILAQQGLLIYKIKGVSMLPMLRQNRDLVHISPPAGRLKKYDVAFYRRSDGTYVLHRVIRVDPSGYSIRGDNCVYTEQVGEEQLLGVLTAFHRKGKTTSVTAFGYRLYVRLWCGIYPLRRLYKGVRRLAGRILRRSHPAREE